MKVYKCQGRSVQPIGNIYDENGNAYAYEDDSTIDDSGSYDSDPSNSAYDSPTSPSYHDGTTLDAMALVNNLEEVVSTLGELPQLFKKVFLWMPDYLVVLIVSSIGLFVVVGFVKMLS